MAGLVDVVGDTLRDATWQTQLELARLEELLAPLAARNGFRHHDGAALLNRLLQIAGLDVESLSRLIFRSPTLGTLAQVARQVANVTVLDPYPTATALRGSSLRDYHGDMT